MTTKDASELQAPGSLQGVSRRALVKAGIGAISVPAVLRAIPANAQSRVIKIGHVSPRTGPLAGFGEADGFILEQVRMSIRLGDRVALSRCPARTADRRTASSGRTATSRCGSPARRICDAAVLRAQCE